MTQNLVSFAAMRRLFGAAIGALIFGTWAFAPGDTQAATTRPTIVLVHGDWADGSSWDAVALRLRALGYTVYAPPNPLRGVASDSAYLASFLAFIKGPIVLVGHSYGGVVISGAATGNAQVRALVYISAFVPDKGETVQGLASKVPGSEIQTALYPVPFVNATGQKDADLYIRQDAYQAVFCAGIPASEAAAFAISQRPAAASSFGEPALTPAWKTIPSWDLISDDDKVIPPAAQEEMAQRAHATITHVNSPHLSPAARPEDVTKVILAAAAASDKP